MTGHSPLGGSGAERWINCPGSVSLLKRLSRPDTDEPSYRIEGSAAHDVAEAALRSGQDAWEFVGQVFRGVEVSSDMADAVQVYIDRCRPDLEDPGMICWVEDPIGSENRPHPLFYGTVDFAAFDRQTTVLTIRDYKHGEGIAVEADDNAQMKYYAYGIILSKNIGSNSEVILEVVQPRAFHPDGPVRRWITTAGAIREWAETVLIPAMIEAEMSDKFLAGKWCRFCPAKIVCPLLGGMFEAAVKADQHSIRNLNDDRLGLEYQQIEAVKMYIKALEDEVFQRLSSGREVMGAKLVHKRSIRVFKNGAEEALRAALGSDAVYTKPELKSPAEIDKLGPAAKVLTKEWAYSPDTGLTVTLATDKKQAVKVKGVKETFASFAVDVPSTEQ